MYRFTQITKCQLLIIRFLCYIFIYVMVTNSWSDKMFGGFNTRSYILWIIALTWLAHRLLTGIPIKCYVDCLYFALFRCGCRDLLYQNTTALRAPTLVAVVYCSRLMQMVQPSTHVLFIIGRRATELDKGWYQR